jgi:hypothetical protein
MRRSRFVHDWGYRKAQKGCRPGADYVVLLFASGRVVIIGSPDLDEAEQKFSALQDEVTDLLTVDR